MQPVIYLDVLIFLNIIITFLLLRASARLLKTEPSPGRYALGSLLGGGFSLIILAPDMGILLSVFVKLIFSLIIVTAVFNPKTVKNIFRFTAYFFLVNFIFAGIMLFLSSIFSTELMKVSNVIVYINFSFLSLIASSLFCYAVTCLLNRLAARKASGVKELDITLEMNGKSVSGKGLVDTGHGLTDPFSGESVIIADSVFLGDLIPSNVSDYLTGASEKGVKLIPFTSVGAKGLMPSFRCDRAYINGDNEKYILKKPEIAVSCEKLSGSDALLSPDIIENSERRKENAAVK